MNDALILEHVAATGGNTHEMQEHLNETEMDRAKVMSHCGPVTCQNLTQTLKEHGQQMEDFRKAQDKRDRETWAKFFPDRPYPFGGA